MQNTLYMAETMQTMRMVMLMMRTMQVMRLVISIVVLMRDMCLPEEYASAKRELGNNNTHSASAAEG